MAKPKYGVINKAFPTSTYSTRIPTAASQTFAALGGRFVAIDASGNAIIALAASGQLAGWTEDVLTSSSVAAADSVSIIDDLAATFEIPSSAAFTAANLKTYIWKTCDIAISGSGTTTIQQANPAASSTDVIVIVGGDVAAQTFYVKINPLKQFTTGVV